MRFSFKKADKDIKVDFQRELVSYPETIYVSTSLESYGTSSYITSYSEAHKDLDAAVPTGGPVDVGIYQLVRVAKFQKQPVEIPKAAVTEIL